MNDLNQVLAEIGRHSASGIITVALERLFACFTGATGGERQRIYGALRCMLKRLPFISEMERGRIRSKLESVTDNGNEFLEGERQSVLECLSGVAPMPPLPSGSVLLLLESKAPFLEQQFGDVQPLVVGVEHWGRRIPRLLHDVDWDALQAGFEPAVHAAKDYIRGRLQGGLDLDIRLGETAVTGRLPWLREKVEGYSLGLGSAIALLSRVLDLPVPADTAFTGRVELNGDVALVSGCVAKAAAAREKGLRRIIVPEQNKKECLSVGGIECVGVNCLEEAVAATFDTSSFNRALEEFKVQALPAELRRRNPWGPNADDAATPRVLLSCISDGDPDGRPGRDANQPAERGPILTLCDKFRPRAVYIFYVADRRQDWEKKISTIKSTLADELPEIRSVEGVFLENVTNPSNFEQLLPAFRNEVMKIVRNQGIGETIYLINTTSGTGQMMLSWFLLYERGIIPQGRLYQVRTTKQAESEPRVCEVMLPVL